MTNSYILDKEGNPQPATLDEWGRWFNSSERIIDKTEIGKVLISTVFLGINHRFGEGPPVLFETMIFGGPHDGDMWRYTTKAEAKAGHMVAVDLLTPHP